MPATAPDFELREVSEDIWEIPASARPDMRVPARVFADPELPISTDVHQGYGFPVGGVRRRR